MRREAQGEARRRFEGVEPLRAQDIADGVGYMVTRPRHETVNELLVRPTEQQG